MEIKTIDELLHFANEKSMIGTSKSTSNEEQRLIDRAIQFGLLFESSKGIYKLAQKGFDVVDSGLTWNLFKDQEKDSFGDAQTLYFGNAIADAASKKTGKSFENPLMQRTASEPIELHSPPVQKKPFWKKVASLQDNPLINQRIAFWAGVSGIIGLVITLIALKFG